MTAQELHDKLMASGTGESKLVILRDLIGDAEKMPSADDAYDALKAAGVTTGTLLKARIFMDDPDADPHVVDVMAARGKGPEELTDQDRAELADSALARAELAKAKPDAVQDDYNQWTVDDLQCECEERELPKYGIKSELVKRLQDDDKKKSPLGK